MVASIASGFEMEWRTCICPCARRFRVWVKSTARHYSYYECMEKTPNDGRLEFTGVTSYATRAARRKERALAGDRNPSRWDRRSK